ncbi:zinc-dependent alcohol dehydrogenase family protein [Pseudomonas abyssi]|uniref:Enoyl reductase (ER) domain-containing protein n=1 Tax=Pseudomonas abyssi TaxID=170540 RepID=A0A395R0N9_9PSED|nr:NAD(P)-dependent alcohol dehydrogenase [Halopseudomonas gallaeciensis]RGP53653.1 hypothetical protein ASB58_14865 [Halopseudomonas gallaeciensis]
MWKVTLGEKPGVSQLKREKTTVPRPAVGEVLVKVKAVSLNYRDWEVINGQYHEVFSSGMVPLSDGAGEVVEVGEGVDRWQPGDRVIGSFWQGWLAGDLKNAIAPRSMGGPLDGMLSEFVSLPANGLVLCPSHLSYEQAACLPCAAVTAWQALVVEGHVKAGDWVLVQGTGGVSLFALQFAKLHGASVVLLSSSEDKLARARELGADITLNYLECPDWGAEVQLRTGGIDHVVEVGGPNTLVQSFKALRLGGQVNIIGYLGGKCGEVSPLLILQSHSRVRGIAVGPCSSLEALCGAIQAVQLIPVIDRIFSVDNLGEAFDYLASGSHMGKVVLRLDS